MSEKFLDQSGLVVLRNWVLSKIANAQAAGSGVVLEPLWINLTPGSFKGSNESGARKRIELSDDVENYDFLMIVAAYSSGYIRDSVVAMRPARFHTGRNTLISFYHPLDNSHASRAVVAAFGNEMWFGLGYKANAANPDYLIPQAIYGVNVGLSTSLPDYADGVVTLVGVPEYDETNDTWSSTGTLTFTGTKEKNGNNPAFSGLYDTTMTNYNGCWRLVTNAATNSHCYLVSNEAIDVTDYDWVGVEYIIVSYPNANTALIGLMSSKPTIGDSSAASAFALSTRVTTTADRVADVCWLDVRSMTGSYYLAAHVAGSSGNYNGIANIIRAWMVKEAELSAV